MSSPVKTRSRSRHRSKSATRRSSRSHSRTRSNQLSNSVPKKGRASESIVGSEDTYTDSGHSSQEKASVTPVRQSARIASIVSLEKINSSKIVEKITSQAKLHMMGEEERSPLKANNRYEFGGPIGVLVLMFLLPATLYMVNLACRKGKCTLLEFPILPNHFAFFVDLESMCIFMGWFLLQALFAILPIGRIVDGQPLCSGERLKYRMNGFLALVLSLVGFGVGVYWRMPVTVIYAQFFKLMTSAVVFSLFLSFFLYIKSRFARLSKLSVPGNTGNVIYDFFMGRELNPRIGPLDLKCFCELRPGLIGWVMLNLAMLSEAYQRYQHLPVPLTMVAIFQFMYVADVLWFEDGILTTMDITHDGFGYMLAFGDVAWVPFLYCLQPRYLLENNVTLSWYCLAPVVVLHVIGYCVFRGANSQKDAFRKNPSNPSLAHLETLVTPSGKRLLVSGWWGMCRKPNYLGDLLMALAWSLTCGFGSAVPYFYPAYLLLILMHRERRDSAACRLKHGTSWDRYLARVRYRIIPFVY